MSEHTKEPWRTADEMGLVLHSDGHIIANCETTGMPKTEYANARRIVACVNACAGIKTEILERGARHDWGDLMQEIERERDALALIATMTAGALENAGFDEVDNPADAIGYIVQQRDAALAVIEQMREALKHLRHNAYKSGADMGLALDVAESALALQPDLTALRKRDAETLRKAVKVCMGQQYDLRTRQTFSGAIRTLADSIEKGEAP